MVADWHVVLSGKPWARAERCEAACLRPAWHPRSLAAPSMQQRPSVSYDVGSEPLALPPSGPSDEPDRQCLRTDDRMQNSAGASTAIEVVGAVVPRLGGPEVLTVQPWQIPVPAADEVRIRVEAAGISFADLLVMQGVHPERRKPPFVPGWDVVGEVESTSAVCVVMDYIVAYQMLTRSAQVQTGDTVLFQGVGGGVGTAFMQVAHTLGVKVLGTDREKKRAHIEAHGATLIDFETEDVVQRCRELTAGRGVEAAFDGVGDTATASLRAVRRGGRLVWFGMVTMLSSGRRDLAKIAKTASLVGAVFAPNLVPGGKRTSLYSIQLLARIHPDWYRQDVAALLRMLVEGDIEPRIAKVWSLSEAPAAADGLAHGALPGKQVISFA